jgi:hypothetical protein
MPWRKVTIVEIQRAMTLCDGLGIDKFRTHIGSFHAARNLHMYWNGRGPYEARPLLAAAFDYLIPSSPAMQPGNFIDNDAHEFLEQHFGFQRVII